MAVVCRQCGSEITSFDDLRAENYLFTYESYHEKCKTVWKWWKIVYFIIAAFIGRGRDGPSLGSILRGTAEASVSTFYIGLPRWPLRMRMELVLISLAALLGTGLFVGLAVPAFQTGREGNIAFGYALSVVALCFVLSWFNLLRYYLQVWEPLSKISRAAEEEQNEALKLTAGKVALAVVAYFLMLVGVSFAQAGLSEVTEGNLQYVLGNMPSLVSQFADGLVEVNGPAGLLLFVFAVPLAYLGAVLVFSLFTKKTWQQLKDRTNAMRP